jgi:hypothetical protein
MLNMRKYLCQRCTGLSMFASVGKQFVEAIAPSESEECIDNSHDGIYMSTSEGYESLRDVLSTRSAYEKWNPGVLISDPLCQIDQITSILTGTAPRSAVTVMKYLPRMFGAAKRCEMEDHVCAAIMEMKRMLGPRCRWSATVPHTDGVMTDIVHLNGMRQTVHIPFLLYVACAVRSGAWKVCMSQQAGPVGLMGKVLEKAKDMRKSGGVHRKGVK